MRGCDSRVQNERGCWSHMTSGWGACCGAKAPQGAPFHHSPHHPSPCLHFAMAGSRPQVTGGKTEAGETAPTDFCSHIISQNSLTRSPLHLHRGLGVKTHPSLPASFSSLSERNIYMPQMQAMRFLILTVKQGNSLARIRAAAIRKSQTRMVLA